MTDFKAKMHHIRYRLGLCPRPRWGSLQRSLRLPSWIWGLLRGRVRGWVGEEEGNGRGEWMGGKGRAPKILLNQDPSQPCYATVQCVRMCIINNNNNYNNAPKDKFLVTVFTN